LRRLWVQAIACRVNQLDPLADRLCLVSLTAFAASSALLGRSGSASAAFAASD
jgi:hypothetical protein